MSFEVPVEDRWLEGLPPGSVRELGDTEVGEGCWPSVGGSTRNPSTPTSPPGSASADPGRPRRSRIPFPPLPVPAMAHAETPAVPELLMEDYRLKLDYLRGQYDRLWSRFNFFLTVELAVFGVLGFLTFDTPNPRATLLPGGLGVAVSLLWYVVSAQDRALVDAYRERADRAAARIAGSEPGIRWFEHEHAARGVGSRWDGPLSWYWERTSVTRLPALLALALLALWIGVLVFWPALAAELAPRASAQPAPG